VSLTGEAHDATIYTRINISITELLSMNAFTAVGVNLNLPEVADRELKTQVRCRPGDTVLLGGITVSRAADAYSKGFAILSKSESSKQTELVITIKPRLLLFDNKPVGAAAQALKPKEAEVLPVAESVVEGERVQALRWSPRLMLMPVTPGDAEGAPSDTGDVGFSLALSPRIVSRPIERGAPCVCGGW
jgi:hypothetical protein